MIERLTRNRKEFHLLDSGREEPATDRIAWQSKQVGYDQRNTYKQPQKDDDTI
jgi:hypothetical protein